jgi:hypothetical protein
MGSHDGQPLTTSQIVLSMSDLQIVTGISILVSGFASLRCGLSAYHWQVLVYLAWFSSITHLSALSFLRNYLYNHQTERLLRLISMFLFIVMLLIAMLPTGNFTWLAPNEDSPAVPGSFAACYFPGQLNRSLISFQSMLLSVLLLVVAFGNRVIKLHELLSTGFGGRLRAVY